MSLTSYQCDMILDIHAKCLAANKSGRANEVRALVQSARIKGIPEENIEAVVRDTLDEHMHGSALSKLAPA